MKEISGAPSAINFEKIKTERESFELNCMVKIKKNEQCIAQFRENAANIGPILKARFDKKVAELEQKNTELLKQLEELNQA